MAFQMHLNPVNSAILGLKSSDPPKPKINNPFYEATELEKAGDYKKAEALYTQLLNSDFDNCAILAALGMHFAVQEKTGLAFTLLERALSSVDDIIPAFKRVGIIPKCDTPENIAGFIKIKRSEIKNAIGTCYKHENNVSMARQYFEAAQEGLPPNADIQNNLGTLFINEGKPSEALEYMDRAISISPDHGQAHWNKSLALLELGDYEHGWPEYDYGFQAKVRNDRSFTKTPLPNWDGTPNKRIIVYGEQGIGDEIMFASCIPDLIACSTEVVFECHKKLHTLFANSFPTLDIYPTREDPELAWPIKPDNTPRYNFDYRVAIGSLPQFFRKNINQFQGIPYIVPSPKNEADWAVRLNKLGPKPKIGISWIGGHKKTRIEVRSLQLEQLLPILSQDADFISLQYTPHEDELAAFEKNHGIHIHQFPEACYSPNYDDTAGLVANLDLVITVCTSLVHLAASMGVPTWVLTPSRPAWRYRLDLDYMPWYGKSVTLFRQDHDTIDWTPVIAEVSANLTALIETTEEAA